MVGGGRLTGRAGRYSIGALNIQTDDKPSARRGRHQLHGAAPQAQHAAAQQHRRDRRRGARRARGRPATARATRSAPTRRCCSSRASTLTSYYARTSTPGVARRTTGASYRGRFDYTDDRYGAAAEHMLIGRDFRPEVGYVRRTDFRRSFGQARFSPRPKQQHARAQADVAGQPRLRDRRAGDDACRTARRSGLFRIDFQIERSAASFELHARVRAAAGDRSPSRRASSCRPAATTTRHEPRDLHPRPAAEGLGPAVGRRPARSTTARKSEVTYSGRWGVRAAVLGGAGRDARTGCSCRTATSRRGCSARGSP